MNKKIFLKPAPGVKVRCPIDGAFLPEGGAWKQNCSYWMRRKEDGSVIETDGPENETGLKPASTKTTKKEDSK